jgi:hypothetical protein
MGRCSDGAFDEWVDGETWKAIVVDQQHGSDEGRRKQWFGMRRQYGGLEHTNIVWAFMEFGRRQVEERAVQGARGLRARAQGLQTPSSISGATAGRWQIDQSATVMLSSAGIHSTPIRGRGSISAARAREAEATIVASSPPSIGSRRSSSRPIAIPIP